MGCIIRTASGHVTGDQHRFVARGHRGARQVEVYPAPRPLAPRLPGYRLYRFRIPVS
jgi:hypothetical protein